MADKRRVEKQVSGRGFACQSRGRVSGMNGRESESESESE